MQWFVWLAIGGLLGMAMHLALSRRRKAAHAMPAMVVRYLGAPSGSDLLAQPATNNRIGKIISEIPKRRVRH